MIRPSLSLLFAALLLLVGVTQDLAAQSSAGDQARFSRFVAKVEVLCNQGSSLDCADLAWDFVDRNRDDRLSLSEVTTFQQDLQNWFLGEGQELPQRTRNGIALGLIIGRAVGVPRLLASYDANGDGELTRAEAFADIKLDERRLSQVVKDPQSFDRPTFVKRLGLAGPLLQGLE